MFFARAWKLCLESCSSSSYAIILGTPKFLLHMTFFLLNFFHAVLPPQDSCHRPPQTWHTYMWEIGGDRWEQSPLISEENGNFVIQNLKSRRILTLKFVLTPWAAFIHRSRTEKGQKNATSTSLHRPVACGTPTHKQELILFHLWRHPFLGAV